MTDKEQQYKLKNYADFWLHVGDLKVSLEGEFRPIEYDDHRIDGAYGSAQLALDNLQQVIAEAQEDVLKGDA